MEAKNRKRVWKTVWGNWSNDGLSHIKKIKWDSLKKAKVKLSFRKKEGCGSSEGWAETKVKVGGVYITSFVSSLFLEADFAKIIELKQDLKWVMKGCKSYYEA